MSPKSHNRVSSKRSSEKRIQAVPEERFSAAFLRIRRFFFLCEGMSVSLTGIILL